MFESKINKLAQVVTEHIDNFRLSQAVELLYSKFWHWYCDEAIEQAKLGKIGAKQMRRGLETFLKLLHPFAPFVTEAIWQQFPERSEKYLITASWPEP